MNSIILVVMGVVFFVLVTLIVRYSIARKVIFLREENNLLLSQNANLRKRIGRVGTGLFDVQRDYRNMANQHELQTLEIIRLKDIVKESRIDAVTKLLSRNALEEYIKSDRRETLRLNENERRAHRSQGVVFMFDIDHFKMVNDTHGHQAGDYILGEVGRILNDNIRKSIGILARFGGEEFIDIEPFLSLDLARERAEKIRTSIEEFIFTYEAKEIRCTVSIGIASYKGDMKKGIAQADKALYEAKESGRNKVIVATATYIK